MAAPNVFVSTFRVKEGKVEDLKKLYDKILEIVQANEPQLIAFHAFLNEDETEMTSIQVHPDTASMDFHMQVLTDNWNECFSEYSQMVETIKAEYYGTPPESALEMDVQAGIAPSVKPRHIAGSLARPAFEPMRCPLRRCGSRRSRKEGDELIQGG